ncbi:SGNH/GDSL hydrolase family protein [Pseudonocardia abyssalis]|uniref:SGNH/GDSL hydrolase family protein n=1 Tax=Pseudonocardia abyssalis TaxID=2792008 RepID=A0ABS6UPK9_9PSEU|nr:SGNH/GDSL hydrolase family protein [Pseudonocardia abyssalis]MBW0115570.1 SGNH/GDSL hydrolase family protein [Pseudonocardia abyssalis]MBW0134200.1 SGNH/GDSL hydrolase family protein [Pseudonocardia abyssalis]
MRLSPVRIAKSLVPATVLALGVVLATPAGAAPAESPFAAEPLFDSYVALGDSFAAGPLIPLQTGTPAGCLRSNRNYPTLVAQTGRVPDFRDVSCSGGRTDDLFAPQVTQLGTNPPQLDALGTDTAGVTLSIGGNDIGFATIISECATRSPREPLGAACRDFFTGSDGSDELAARIDDTAPKVGDALAAIAERSPDAEVYLVGYPAILPEGAGCFPVVPFSAGDVAYLRDTEKALNAMLAEEAAAAGVTFVDTYERFIGHDVCTLPGTKWIEGLVPTSPAAPVHPNALGMLSMAQDVLAAAQG